MRHVLALSLLCAALSACGGSAPPATPSSSSANATASQEAISRIGDVTIRASAIPTSTLSEPVARQYGIARSDDTVMLLIGVRQGESAQETALPATITATATDLRGRTHPVEMRELRSGDATTGQLLDYVGTVDMTPPDTLRFDVTIVREGGATSQMQFTRDFYPRWVHEPLSHRERGWGEGQRRNGVEQPLQHSVAQWLSTCKKAE